MSYTHRYTDAHINIYACMYIYIEREMYTTYVQILLHTYMHIYMYIYLFIHVHVCLYMHAYIYIYVCMCACLGAWDC